MNMKGSHRGVETIISAMIQIVIMVAAFSLAYGAYFSWVSTQRRGSMMQMQERMVVEAVRFQSSTTASTASSKALVPRAVPQWPANNAPTGPNETAWSVTGHS